MTASDPLMLRCILSTYTQVLPHTSGWGVSTEKSAIHRRCVTESLPPLLGVGRSWFPLSFVSAWSIQSCKPCEAGLTPAQLLADSRFL
jgi:hypothetical protein